MGISSKLTDRINDLDEKARKRLIRMAWEDRVSYKEIQKTFGFTANEVEKFMRKELPEKDFKRWRLRQSKRFTLKSKKAALLNR